MKLWFVMLALLLLSACASSPLVPYSTDTPPLVLAPAAQAGVKDQRARFREIFCAVLEARGTSLPDYRPCDQALARVGAEAAGAGRPVNLDPSQRGLRAVLVPGFGYDCFEKWLELPGTVIEHLRGQGFELSVLKVEGLSGTASNARIIRDSIMAMPAHAGPPRIVLVGYSKGSVDILDALATYPELRTRVAAFVSVAGAIGGSPLANDSEQGTAELLMNVPGATCTPGDRGAVASMRPDVRQRWLADNALPKGVH